MLLPPYVGVTGPNASGKGEVAEWLGNRHGHRCRSLSDVIREEARRRGLEPVRSVLISLGNELRREHGPAALAELILEDLTPPAVIDSIRNPAEVEVLRRLPGFVLVAIEAPIELRFERSLERARPGDPLDLEAFRQREDQENSNDPAAQQLRATARLADATLVNDGSLDELGRRVETILAELGSTPRAVERVDALGLLCPLPILRLEAAARRAGAGAVVELLGDDEGIREDLPAWCEGNGHELLSLAASEEDGGEVLLGRVRTAAAEGSAKKGSDPFSSRKGV